MSRRRPKSSSGSSRRKNKSKHGGEKNDNKSRDAEEKASRMRMKEKQAFDTQVTKAELRQANAWLAKKHTEAEVALMDTLSGTRKKNNNKKQQQSALYAGRHAYTGEDSLLKIQGQQKTLLKRPDPTIVDPHRVDLAEERLRKAILNVSSEHVENAKALQRFFKGLDEDGSGQLSVSEVKHALTKLGVPCTRKEVEELVEGLDIAGDGGINYDEFIRIAFPRDTSTISINTRRKKGTRSLLPDDDNASSPLTDVLEGKLKEMIRNEAYSERSLRTLFKKFDKSGTGKISRVEFRRAFSELGLTAPSKEVQQLMNRLDIDGDGLISYKEFIVAGSSNNSNDSNSSRRRRRKGDYDDDVAVSRPHLNLGTTELMSRKLKVMIRDAAWNEKSLRRVFTKFDEKGNGEITAREFKKAFNKLNLYATNKEIDNLVDKLDRTGDGVVRYADFIAAAEVEAGPSSKEQRKLRKKWGDDSDDEYDKKRRRRRKYRNSSDDDDDDNNSSRRRRRKQKNTNDRKSTKSRKGSYSDDDDDDDDYNNNNSNNSRKNRSRKRSKKNSSSDISDEEDEKRRRSRRRDRSPRSKSRSRSKDRRKRKGKDDEGVFGPVLREMVMKELKDHKDLHGLFKKIDKNKNGYLSRAEFKRAFAEMGLNAPRHELQKLISHLDKNGDGEIDYKEFINAVKKLHKRGNAYDDALDTANLGVVGILASKLREIIDESAHDAKSLKRLFLEFDEDQNGTISTNEFQKIFKKLGLPVNKSEVRKLMKKIDRDHDGLVDYGDFLSALNTNTAGSGAKSTRKLTEEMHRFLGRHTMTERSIKNMFKIADANGSGKLNRKEFARVIKSMGLRPRDNQVEEMLNMLDQDGDGLISYGEFIDEVMYAAREFGGWKNISRQEFQDVDIGLAVAGMEELGDVADSLVQLRRENDIMKREMSQVDVNFFGEVTDLRSDHEKLMLRNKMLEEKLLEMSKRANVDATELMRSIDNAYSMPSNAWTRESERRNKHNSNRKSRRRRHRHRRDDDYSSSSSFSDNSYYSSDEDDRRGRRRNRGKDRKNRKSNAAPVKKRIENEWKISDQWIKAVFDEADGSALVELERYCRTYDVSNSGCIAAPELRIALRQALNPPVNISSSLELYGGLPPGLSPSALVFGELIRRFESRMSRMGLAPNVDYESLLTAILNRGKVHKSITDDPKSAQLFDDAIMELIRSHDHNRDSWIEIFDEIDMDGNGKISVKEFRRAFKKLRIRATKDQIFDLVDVLDKDGDGNVSYNEFLDAIYEERSTKSKRRWKLSDTLLELIEDANLSRKECANVFRDFDKDDSGKLNHKEFKKAMKELNIRASRDDIEDLIDDMDRDGDGYVSYKEFMDAVFSHKKRSKKKKKKKKYSDDDYSDDDEDRKSRSRNKKKKRRSPRDRSRSRSRSRSPRDKRRSHGKDTRKGGKNRYISALDAKLRRKIQDASWSKKSLTKLFKKIDKDGNGKISIKEFQRIFEDDMAIRVSKSDVRKLMERMDEDGDGYVDYGEFVAAALGDADSRTKEAKKEGQKMIAKAVKVDWLTDKLRKKIQESHNRKDLEEVFEEFDKDDSGKISRREFKEAFSENGIRLTSSEIDAIFEKLDKNGDHEISYKEFCNGVFNKHRASSSRSGRKYGTTKSSLDDIEDYSGAVDLALRKLVQKDSWSTSSLKRLFRQFDKTGSGKITVGEFKLGFAEMGLKVTTKEIVELIDRLDTQGNGTIDYNEFVKAALLPVRGMDSVEILDETLRQMIWDASFSQHSLRRLFSRFDRTGSGLISKKDFQHAFGKMGLSASLQDVKDLLRRLDRNGDGLIDYGEFIDAAFVATNQKSRKKTRWGKRNPLRSISPVRRAGGGFRYGR